MTPGSSQSCVGCGLGELVRDGVAVAVVVGVDVDEGVAGGVGDVVGEAVDDAVGSGSVAVGVPVDVIVALGVVDGVAVPDAVCVGELVGGPTIGASVCSPSPAHPARMRSASDSAKRRVERTMVLRPLKMPYRVKASRLSLFAYRLSRIVYCRLSKKR